MKQRHLLLALFALLSMTQARADVVINETNFPDANFRSYLLEQSYGSDGVITDAEIAGSYGSDGVITDAEIAGISEIIVDGKNIQSLKGIEFFSALTHLRCSNNQITSLDVSKNTALYKLRCGNNQLTALDVSKNTALETLSCGSNQLTSLDVSQNTELKTLDCSSSQLTALDVSKNTALNNLRCHKNQITALDVSKNTALSSLDCSSNQLTSLDVSQNTALNNLRCYNNQIKGESMDALVASLPQRTMAYNMYVIFNENEGNVMTTTQVTAAKSKGWTPLYYDGTQWIDYAGSEPVAESIAINETNFPDANFRSYLLEQSYGSDGVICR